MAITINAVPESQLNDYSPDMYDAVSNGDGTYRLTPVLWRDDASYATYQGDTCHDSDTPPAVGSPEWTFLHDYYTAQYAGE